MKLAFIIFYCILIAVLFTIQGRIKKGQSKIGDASKSVIFWGTVTVVFSAAAMIVPNVTLSTLFYGLFSAGIDWVLIALLIFAQRFTQNVTETKASKAIIIGICCFDSILLIINTFTHIVFKVGTRTLPYVDVTIYDITEKTGLYNLHLAICYIVSVFIFLSLIYGVITSASVYRRKYLMVLILFLITLVLDGLMVFAHFFVGTSIIIYTVMAVVLYYYSVVYVPRAMLGSVLASTVQEFEDAVICFDNDLRCVYINEAGKKIFGITDDDYSALSANVEKWLNGTEPELQPDSEITESREMDGELRHYTAKFRKVFDKKGKFVSFYFAITDNTEDINAIQLESYKATHDSLTGLYNRNGFYEAVAERLKEDPDTKWVIVCSDIKDFKFLNDLFGVSVGDEVLKNVAKVLTERCMGNDSIPARINTDKFALFMRRDRYATQLFEEDAQDAVQLINQSIEYKIICYVGVYEIVSRDIPVSTMCDRAFFAIESIKGEYNKVVAVYDESLRSEALREQEIVSSMQEAMDTNQFKIYLQPQVVLDEAGNEIVSGAEALARWIDPEKGMISPGLFIPILEKTGLIAELDRYIWEEACKQLRIWKNSGYDHLYISINISPKDFYYLDIYETLTKLVQEYDVSPSSLKIEITESAIINDLRKQVALIDRLREYGFSVEMDDFGSGYSSLGMLKDINIDVLKIDMSFLAEEKNKDRSRIILDTIVEMAKKLEISVITEGVETEEQVEFLMKAGCNTFQGYYFARPMPVRSFEEKYINN